MDYLKEISTTISKELFRGLLYALWVIVMSSVLWIVYGYHGLSDEQLLLQWCLPRTFEVTSYYSPLSTQSLFFQGDFEREIRLNGKGIAWASGRPVFNGMLAAPSSYAFGSRIYLEWLGRGEVADRWGAIVEKGELWYRDMREVSHDRIDIRVGKGDEWLIRALWFGRQERSWRYCPDPEKQPHVTIWFDVSSLPVWKNFFDVSLFQQEMSIGRNDIRSYTLQKYLIALWYLDKGLHTGKFAWLTQQAVCNFQVDYGVVPRSSSFCGYFGARTRATLQSVLKRAWLLPANLWAQWSMDNVVAQARHRRVRSDVIEQVTIVADSSQELIVDEIEIDEIEPKLSEEVIITLDDITLSTNEISEFTQPYNRGEYHESIILLQKKLRLLWQYGWPIDGIYSDALIASITNLQFALWVLDGQETNYSVHGYLWPSTRKAFNSIDRYGKIKEYYEAEEALFAQPFDRSFSYGESDEEIVRLQKILIKREYYEWTPTWIYDDMTLDAVYQFQLDQLILTSASKRSLRGYFGPSTRRLIVERE